MTVSSAKRFYVRFRIEAWRDGKPVMTHDFDAREREALIQFPVGTLADNEFATPYRVINYHACNGCWNDIRHRFDHHDFMWCPRHANTKRQFECTRLVTVEQVKAAIRRIPGFAGG